MSIIDIEAKIEKAKADLAKLEDELEQIRSLTPEQRLAETLHAILCTWNHTDGCSWFYESDKNKWTSGSNHREYLARATRLMNFCCTKGITPEDALEIFAMIKSR